MADPPTTPLPPPPILPDPHRQPLHLPLLHGGATTPSSSTATPTNTSLIREYRKGNWTIQETLILITAKKLDDERRLRTSSSSSTQDQPSNLTATSGGSGRTSGELRWKWVENYCWSRGCLRSQNQCNDKWDNLLRDYKKVRDYESKVESSAAVAAVGSGGDFPSYWNIDKHQRKERNLPSNMVFEVYQAISDVLQRKQSHRNNSPQPPPPQLQPPQPNPVAVIPPAPPQQHQPPPPPLLPPPPPHAPVGSTTPAVSGNIM